MPRGLQANLVLPLTSNACRLMGSHFGVPQAHPGKQMEFPERLKKARERRGLNQTELGNILGVSPQTVQLWEAGKTMPRHKRIDTLAKQLGVRSQWLIFGQGSMSESGPDEMVMHDTEIVEDEGPLAPDEIEIPFFREVEMAAGDGRTQVIENHGCSMRFSLARLAKAGIQPHNAACATIAGSSMEPVIKDGSPIGIDKGCRHIIDGEVYALDHGGMLRVKRLYRAPLNRMRVVSDNQVEYPEEIYMIGDPEAPRIIGRVFWWETFA